MISLDPAAATISGDGVSPAASASASGSPPGSDAETASADAGRSLRIGLEAAQDRPLDAGSEIRNQRGRRRRRVRLALALQLVGGRCASNGALPVNSS